MMYAMRWGGDDTPGSGAAEGVGTVRRLTRLRAWDRSRMAAILSGRAPADIPSDVATTRKLLRTWGLAMLAVLIVSGAQFVRGWERGDTLPLVAACCVVALWGHLVVTRVRDPFTLRRGSIVRPGVLRCSLLREVWWRTDDQPAALVVERAYGGGPGRVVLLAEPPPLSGPERGLGAVLAAAVAAADRENQTLVVELGYGEGVVVPRYERLLERHGFAHVDRHRLERAPGARVDAVAVDGSGGPEPR